MLRWTFAVVGLLLVAPYVRGQDDAQKLFDAMEQKLAQAKAQKLEFEIEAQDLKRTAKLKGTLVLSDGNRMKITYEGQESNQKRLVKVLFVSEVKTYYFLTEIDGKPDKETGKVDAKQNEVFVSHLSRTALWQGYSALVSEAHPKHAAMIVKLSAFKSAGKDQVGGLDANVIEYQLEYQTSPKENATCKLWLDAKTDLPLKRVLEVTRDGKFAAKVVETYSQWAMDPKLPEGFFAVPK